MFFKGKYTEISGKTNRNRENSIRFAHCLPMGMEGPGPQYGIKIAFAVVSAENTNR